MRFSSERPFRRNRKGFALLYVVIAISLVSMALIVLTQCSDDLVFTWNRSWQDACHRDLVASGAAWARVHASQLTTAPAGKNTAESQGKEIRLDVSELHIVGGELAVQPLPPDGGKPRVKIDSAAISGGKTFRRTADRNF